MHSRRQILKLAIAIGVMIPAAARAEGSWLDTLKGVFGSSSKPPAPVGEIAAALKQALEIGSLRVIRQVGTRDGFQKDPHIHIPLPGALAKVQEALRHIGLSGMADDLELRINRGAEQAASEAKDLFVDALQRMTVQDAVEILNGPKDSATRYFRRTMTPALRNRFRPIVRRNLAKVGAIRSFDQMMKQYRQLPFVPDINTELSDYTVERTLRGIFHYLAREEAEIRTNPVRRTTALLKKVFGSKR
ncbi:MAG TPA: DUF4197 domain-containing protein [Rhodospirillaceae bacterium]|nr:hypothetical protein [Rhodospirillaceae bacterium]HAA93087.1 DUF4197 domain-containing protein [Rhodospirillaceae bacterium]HAT34595.1 DUF4197 domain-containing protein [Rhodospirillaceae bacterium]|tara:strand:- start:351 stop:1088 length:738 start_codon:yes stop_codon:yes gene_type:complete